MNITEAIQNTIAQAYLERAARTARAYHTGLKSFERYLEENKITPTDDSSKITTDILVNFPGWMLGHDFKKSTVGVYQCAIRYLIDWLVIQKLYEPDYRDTLRVGRAFKSAQKRREDKLVRHPAKEDADKMRAAVREINYSDHWKADLERARDIAIIEFLIDTGCRNEEICKVCIEQIDLKNLRAIVNGKGDKERYVFITDKTASALRAYWDARGFAGKKDPVFSRHDKSASVKTGSIKAHLSTATIRNVVKACAALAGLDHFTPHWFRHAFAIKMLKDTGNLAIVQDMLGHASPATTRIYAKIEPEDLQEAHKHAFK